ncbi:MAG: FAD:protein FMN transferase [Planctomycetota bacterium]
MGTLFRLVLYAPSSAAAASAAESAWARVDAIELVATDYDPNSEARRLSGSAGEWCAVSADLALVIRAADSAWRRSGGVFDASLGHVTKLWRRALRQAAWPSAERWVSAWSSAGWGRLELREGMEGLRIRLPDPRGGLAMRLDFGGVAKGVAVDEALAALEERGIESALMEGGGDIAALGPPPRRDHWVVDVSTGGTPGKNASDGGALATVALTRGAIATSGDGFQGQLLDGTPPWNDPWEGASRIGHVLDPRTQRPLPGPRTAVMTAATGAEADAFATALLVVGKKSNDGSPSKSVPRALRYGLFFGPSQAEPCVGELFPHDGVRPLTLPSLPDPE